jgi:hypothetical protein
MYLSRHVIISATVFGILYLSGFPKNFILLGFFASILMDIDHLTLCGIFGTYNPVEIYSRVMAGEFDEMFTPKEQFINKWVDFKIFPFHNLFLNAVILITVFPVGVGMLLHNVLDAIDYAGCHLNI